MKKYYVKYGDFANTYRLLYVETEEDRKALPEDAERISRKEALRLAARERERRRENPASSGFADAVIYPASDGKRVDFDFNYFINSEKFEFVNNIFERV